LFKSREIIVKQSLNNPSTIV